MKPILSHMTINSTLILPPLICSNGNIWESIDLPIIEGIGHRFHDKAELTSHKAMHVRVSMKLNSMERIFIPVNAFCLSICLSDYWSVPREAEI